MADTANNGVKNTEEIDTSTTESPAEETNDDGVIALDGEGEPEKKAPEEENEDRSEGKTEDEAETSSSEVKSDGAPSKNAERRKQQLNSEIRDKVAERNALRDEIAELSRQKYDLQPAQNLPTVESLVEQINPNTGDYYTRAEAENLILSQRLDAIERQREFDNYVERTTDSRIQLFNEASQALKDFPVFDPDSDQYNAELTAAADEIMRSSLIMDEKTGQVIGSRISPYKLYSTIAGANASGETAGKASGRKAALDMANSADVSGSVAAPSSDGDDNPFLKGFQKGSNY